MNYPSKRRPLHLYLGVAVVFLLTADRLPAPVQELPDPSPTTTRTAEPAAVKKPKRSHSSARARPAPSATPSPPLTSEIQRTGRFAGKWIGTIQTIPWGPWSVVLAVDGNEATMTQHINREQPLTAPAHRNGEILQARFPAGLTTITWSLMPQSDGATARVRFQAFMNDFTGTFHRAGSGSAPVRK